MMEGVTRAQHDRPHDEGAWHRFMRDYGLFWTAILYLIGAHGVYDLSTERPDLLRGWPALGLCGLLAAFFALYHLVFLRGVGAMPLRRAAGYGVAQTVVIALLQRYNPTFGNLGWGLIAHLMAVLPPRLWPAPLVGVLAVTGAGWGMGGWARAGNWDDVFLSLLQMVLWIAAFGSLNVLFRQRQRLAALVGELRRAKEELERSAAQAEELAVLRERTRLAREMHDSLGHALVLVNVKLEAAERLYARDAGRGAAELGETRALVRGAMADLRRSLENLRAPLPGGQDLAPALRRLAEEVGARARLGVTVEIAPDLDLPALAPELATALWRVAREALTNVERHAAAASVALALCKRGELIVLRVTDDGSGIPPAAPPRPGHYGITGMRERVAALGGALRIQGRPGGGTVVEAYLPLGARGAADAPGDVVADDEPALVGEGGRV